MQGLLLTSLEKSLWDEKPIIHLIVWILLGMISSKLLRKVDDQMNDWNTRFQTNHYVYGKERFEV